MCIRDRARSTRFVSQLGNCAAAYCNPDCPLFCARLLHFLCRDQLGCETTCTHRSSRPQSAQRSVGYVFHMAQNRSACAGMPAASGYKFRRGGLSWYGLEVMSSGTSVPFTPYSAPHLGAIPNPVSYTHLACPRRCNVSDKRAVDFELADSKLSQGGEVGIASSKVVNRQRQSHRL